MTLPFACWPRWRVMESQNVRMVGCSLEELRVGQVLHLSRARIWGTAGDGSFSFLF
jgi:hypothetical protein